MKIKNIYSLLEIGKRKNIEDYIFPYQDNATLSDKVFIVCDGVGGENKGEIASKITADTIGQYLNGIEDITEIHLKFAFNLVKQNFEKYMQLHPEASKMSTTLTLAVIKENSILVAWCGDSKIALIRKNKILWKSKDHSLVQHLLDIGEINVNEAANHPKKNVIFRSISANTKEEDIDFYLLNDVQQDDYLILATDGIFEQINDEILIEILNHENENKAKLIYAKCEGKTNDNYSMFLLKFSPITFPFFTKKNVITSALILITFIIAFFFFLNKDDSIIEPEKKEDTNKIHNVVIPVLKKDDVKKETVFESKKESFETKKSNVLKTNTKITETKIELKKEKLVILSSDSLSNKNISKIYSKIDSSELEKGDSVNFMNIKNN